MEMSKLTMIMHEWNLQWINTFFSKKTGMAAVVILVYKIMLEVSVSSPGKKDRR